jgi:hypothetical protein
MAQSARYLTFEGQFESSVLGTFRIIRGFANLKDLAEVSVPYKMEDACRVCPEIFHELHLLVI